METKTLLKLGRMDGWGGRRRVLASGRRLGPALAPSGASVGDVLPSGRAGGRLAGPLRLELVELDPARSVVGASRLGGPGWLGDRPVPGGLDAQAGDGGPSLQGGRTPAAALRLARSDRPGAWTRPQPIGDGPAQLRRGRPDRPADVLARPALARLGRGPGRGGPHGVQPASVDPDEGGVALDLGPGDDLDGDVLLRPTLQGWGRLELGST